MDFSAKNWGILGLGLVALGLHGLSMVSQARAAKPDSAPKPTPTPTQMERTVSPALDFTLKLNDGSDQRLSDFQGKVLLVVNTASECGNTPQYEGLEKIYQKYHEKGFEVLAFPANEFGHQEPGSDAEIRQFCSTKYQVSFPLFAKTVVKGEGINPFFHYLTEESPFPGPIKWNFAKFLIDRQGRVVARFSPWTKPESKGVIKAIEDNL